MFRQLGTILPTAQSLANSEAFYRRDIKARESIAQVELRGCDRRIVGGEVRYYDTTDQYAIVSRQGKILWFAVTADGDFRINK